MVGYELAKAYENNELCGWAEVRNPGIAKESFDLLNAQGAFHNISSEAIGSTGGERRKVFLHNVVRAVLGKDTENYPQQVGDCVAMGAKNASEYLTCAQIAGNAIAESKLTGHNLADVIAKAALQFRSIFAPYYYGTGRVYVGGGQMRFSEDGSLGSWMADAVRKYGTVFSNEPGVPKYSGDVARNFGDPNPGNDLDKWKGFGLKYLVKSTALIKNWDDLVNAIANYYPCTTASNIGYSMEAGSDGFHRQNANWAHQMAIIGVDETYKNGEEPYVLILNTWGDVHGLLKDFQDGSDLPVGVLRVRRRDIEKHIAARETFSFSNFEGFPAQKLDKELFMLA